MLISGLKGLKETENGTSIVICTYALLISNETKLVTDVAKK